MKYKLRKDLPHESESFIVDYLRAWGVSDNDIYDYLNPTPEVQNDAQLLDNIVEGANLLLKHLQRDSNILLVVDSDTDGITSAAILWLYCKKIYPNCKLTYVLHNGKEHGLSDQVGTIEYSHFNLVLLPDAATNDVNECERLHKKDIDVLILDHHVQELDNPYAIVINNQSSDLYPNKGLCGAGVVYKFCQVLDMLLNVSYADEYLDLVALGEVSDMMSLTDIEVRYLVSQGLSNIRNSGLQAFIKKQSFSLKDTSRITPIKIAFYITPLINALIRVGTQKEKELLFNAFIDGDREVQSTKRGAAAGDIETVGEQSARLAVNARTKQNKSKESAIGELEAIIQQKNLLDKKILLLPMSSVNVPNTLTGLIAMHFCNKYQRPVLAARRDNDGFLKGSIRGDDRFFIGNLQEFLLESGLFEYVQGHANASGFSLNENKLDGFWAYVNENLPDGIFDEVWYNVDYAYDTGEDFGAPISELFYYDSIWGQGIPEPIYYVSGIIDKSQISYIGNNSTKITLPGGELIRFKDEEFQQRLSTIQQPRISVIGKASVNEWAGRCTPQLIIQDYEIEEAVYSF